MSNFEKTDKELLTRISEVLHYIWDPIHVSGVPQARDEYDSYAPQIFSLLKKKASQEEIANHLAYITVERMGLKQSSKHDAEVANILIDWMDFYADRQN